MHCPTILRSGNVLPSRCWCVQQGVGVKHSGGDGKGLTIQLDCYDVVPCEAEASRL
jgi:hypothetical protein